MTERERAKMRGARGGWLRPGPVLRTVLSLAIVAAVLWAARSLVDWSAVWAAVLDMSWLEVTTLLLAAAWNIATYLFVMMAALPGLTYRQAFVVGQSSTAVSATLPAGSALGVGMSYGMYTSLGYAPPAIALATVLTGIWNNFVKLSLPVVSLAILAVIGESTAAETGAALIGVGMLLATVAVFAMMLRSDELARRVGAAAQRAAAPLLRMISRVPGRPWAEQVVRFRNQTIGLLHGRWHLLTAATVASHLSLYLVLLLALRHMGVPDTSVGWAEVLGAFAVMRLITALPITPGGLGIVELGLTAALVLAGGAEARVVAAVLVYRVLTLFVQVPIGAATLLYWRATTGRTVRSLQAPAQPVGAP